MFLVAFKNLFQEKTRFAISVGGVAFSVLLIVILQSLYRGWSTKLAEYISTIPTDLWVAQEGTKDMFHSVSFLPASEKANIENISGVDKVNTFRGRRMAFDLNGKEVSIYLVSHDANSPLTGPVRVLSGNHLPKKGEIVIDQTLADRHKVGLGDYLNIAGKDFKIAGIGEGGSVVLYSFAFAFQDDTEEIFKQGDTVNFFLVNVNKNNNSSEVTQKIEKIIPGSKVFTKSEFLKENTSLIRETFLPIIFVLELIGVAVGIAVIGLTIYTSTIEKSREYGVLKAIGVSNKGLYAIVMQQSWVAAILGFVIGSTIALLISLTVPRNVVEFVTELKLLDIIGIFGLTLVMATLSAFIPIHKLSQIDPAEVFKS